eukprot:TRINITY_DN9806_c0_g1_i1.p2 TRINITY_DN9806_c0_g1~~TRINITY_DN9806_c0_g1_i1.p2  ORF type:complete len:114 (-),score=13.17 TRINITY_DN9806_c0_g1_i1:43-384(-)
MAQNQSAKPREPCVQLTVAPIEKRRPRMIAERLLHQSKLPKVTSPDSLLKTYLSCLYNQKLCIWGNFVTILQHFSLAYYAYWSCCRVDPKLRRNLRRIEQAVDDSYMSRALLE